MGYLSFLNYFIQWHLFTNAFIRSGTEEDYTELSQLLEDIVIYRIDMQDTKIREQENKKQKEKKDREKALEMRSAALSGMSSKFRQFNV